MSAKSGLGTSATHGFEAGASIERHDQQRCLQVDHYKVSTEDSSRVTTLL